MRLRKKSTPCCRQSPPEAGRPHRSPHSHCCRYDSDIEEKVIVVPALRAASGEGLECVAPSFPGPCEVTVNVVLDGAETVYGTMHFAYFGKAAARW